MEQSGPDADIDAELLNATKELRSRLRLTQGAFGQRIERAVNTVMRYESQAVPRGEALVPYAALAIESGFDDLAKLFRDALIRDLGPKCEFVLSWKPDQKSAMAIPQDMRALVKAFIKFMNSRELMPAEELARNGLKSLLLRSYSSTGEKSRRHS